MRRWIVLAVLLILAAGAACRDEEPLLGSDMEWWWDLTVTDQELRMDNQEAPYALVVKANSPSLFVDDGSELRPVVPESLAPDALEPHETMIHVDMIRRVLLQGASPEHGSTRRVGAWTLYRTPAFFAIRHPSHPYALAGIAESNGFMASIGADRVGFILGFDPEKGEVLDESAPWGKLDELRKRDTR